VVCLVFQKYEKYQDVVLKNQDFRVIDNPHHRAALACRTALISSSISRSEIRGTSGSESERDYHRSAQDGFWETMEIKSKSAKLAMISRTLGLRISIVSVSIFFLKFT